MKSRRQKNIEELVELGITLSEAIELQKIARELNHLDEINAISNLTPAQERKAETLEQRAQEIAGTKNTAYHNSDPRDLTLWIVRPEDQCYDQGVGVYPREGRQ